MVEVNCNGGLREKRESQSERETGDFFFFLRGFLSVVMGEKRESE